MASFLGEIGRAQQTAWGVPLSLVITVGSTLPVGSRLVAICGSTMNSAGGTAGNSVTDSKGNTWLTVGAGDPNYLSGGPTATRTATFSSLLSVALVAGDTITVDTPKIAFGATTSVVIIAFQPDAPGTAGGFAFAPTGGGTSATLGPQTLTQGAIVAGSFCAEDVTPSLSGDFVDLGSETVSNDTAPGHSFLHLPFYGVVPPGTYSEVATAGAVATYWNGNLTYWAGAVAPLVGPGAWNLHTEFSQYQRAVVAGASVFYQSVDATVPPIARSSVVGIPPSGTDSEPKMVRDWLKRTWLSFTRTGGTAPGVYAVVSDDEGKTWAAPAMAFVGGKHGDIAFDPRTGIVLRTAYVAGQLKGIITDVSGAPTPIFTLVNHLGNPLTPDDDTHHIIPALEGAGRWLLVMTVGGSVTDWYSADDGRTWRQIV